MFALIIYALIGFLLANGLPHFLAGAAGRVFRSPFGRRTAPKVNLAWGLANLIVALILLTWRLTLDTAAHGQMIAMVVGIGLAYVIFGFGANRFYDDQDQK